MPDHVVPFSHKPDNKDISILPISYSYIHGSGLSYDSLIGLQFEICLFKGPLKSIHNVTEITPQLDFVVENYTEEQYEKNVVMDIDFDQRIITFYVTYINYTFQNSRFHQTNTVIASNELLDCYITFNKSFSDLQGFKLNSLKFLPRNGLQQPCTFKFDENHIYKSSMNSRPYYHRIRKQDFQYGYFNEY